MKRKVTPKLTQDQILNLMIDSASEQMINCLPLSDGKRYPITEFIQAKNLDTLKKMEKRGLLSAVRYSGNSFTLSRESMLKYSAEIRNRAITRITAEFDRQWRYAQAELQNCLNWYQYKFIATNKRIEHSPFNNPDFCLFDYTGIVDNGIEPTRIYAKPYPTISNSDDRAYQLQRAIEYAESLTRAEIGTIPIIEICAY